MKIWAVFLIWCLCCSGVLYNSDLYTPDDLLQKHTNTELSQTDSPDDEHDDEAHVNDNDPDLSGTASISDDPSDEDDNDPTDDLDISKKIEKISRSVKKNSLNSLRRKAKKGKSKRLSAKNKAQAAAESAEEEVENKVGETVKKLKLKGNLFG